MRCAIVKSSTVTKHRRMDAAYYIGVLTLKYGEGKVELARKRLAAAEKQLERALANLAADKARVQAMIDAGEITPFPEKPDG